MHCYYFLANKKAETLTFLVNVYMYMYMYLDSKHNHKLMLYVPFNWKHKVMNAKWKFKTMT